jgi:iron complex transport system substrate-binding protein
MGIPPFLFTRRGFVEIERQSEGEEKMQKKIFPVLISLLVLASMLLSACSTAASPTPQPAVDEPAAEAPAVEEPAAEEPVAEEPAVEAPAEEAPAAVTLTDTAGNVVELAALPQRVVVAGKATPFTLSTTYLFEEASDRVVAQELRGMTTPEFLGLIDPKYEEKIKLEMDSGAEAIAPTRPDIVIAKNFAVKALKEPLAQLDIPVVGLNLEKPEVFYQDIEMLGQLFGNPERAAEINDYFKQKVALVAEAMQGLTEEEKPTVLVIQYNEKDGEVAFKVPPASYIQTQMVIDGGGIPVWTDGSGEETDWIVANFEQIAAWNPDIVLVIDYNGNPQETAGKLMQNDTWKELKAAKNQKIYGFGKDYQGWDLPDPRWVLGYTWVASKIQPERMAEVNMTEMVKEFYKVMYRLTDEQIETGIMPIVVAP